jgi:hypothetical protein
MQYNLEEIRSLSELLESEANGLPFDRDQARHLAEKMANQHPAIRRSMEVLLQRLGAGDEQPLAQCA